MALADSYAQTPDGRLMIADGLNPVRIWDGQTAEPALAGLAAPTSAPTLAKSLVHGNIVGTYYAFVRNLDARGNVSSFGPQSVGLEAFLTNVSVADADDTTPIKITTTGPHGLSTGDVATVAGVLGNDGANGTFTVTVIDATSFYLDDSTETGDYIAGGTVTTGVSQINYTNVPLPAEAAGWASKVARRQILRNTAGQATTFYVDVDTTNLVLTSFSSTRTDSELQAQTAVPLFDSDGSVFANAHGVPPRHKSVVAHHSGFMFFLVDGQYSRGAVIVTNGSPTVRGINTKWIAGLQGFFLYVDGANEAYEILSCSGEDTLTLTAAFADLSQGYATYRIRPAPAERNIVYCSEANDPESVAATSAVTLQEDGDELVGAMVKASFIYFIKKRHIYKLTFQNNPLIDGFVFQGAERGLINTRCYAEVEGTAYMLDQAGVHAFSGGDDTEPVSEGIQRIFQPSDGKAWINWKASEQFHAAVYPAEEVIRWFVCMSGQYLPRHALALHHRSKQWWLEIYDRPVTASCLGVMAGQRRVFLGGEGRSLSMLGVGRLDGIAPGAGTIVGDVAEADRMSITDPYGEFPATFAGLSVAIVWGRGRGQVRPIREIQAGGRIVVTMPWLVKPDATSRYQIAGVKWSFLSKRWTWARGEAQMSRRIAFYYKPTRARSYLDLQVIRDENETPILAVKTQSGEEAEGFAAEKDNDTLQADMRRPGGHAQQRMDGQKDANIDGQRRVRFHIGGVAGEDGVEIKAIEIDGVRE